MAKPKPLNGLTFTPRAEEWKPVLEMLESDEFKDGQSMAKALVKSVTAMLWHREWFVGQHIWAGGKPGLIYGPFASEAQAKTFGDSLGVGQEFRIRKVSAPGRVVGILDGAPGVKGFCKTCGHSPFDHGIEGSGRGKCYLPDCTCLKWQEIK